MRTESVWDYPRPPALEPTASRVRVVFGGATIVDTHRALRVLETSHPPVIYVPRTEVAPGVLVLGTATTWCEYKGTATYLSVQVDEATARDAAWTYEVPRPPYGALAGHVAFHPGRMDACLLDDEQVQAQPGDFYGGWITASVLGPFKGAPGTAGW
ncbi:MAG: DUF427 domain-containing protein [Acidimicrobiales bacterium]